MQAASLTVAGYAGAVEGLNEALEEPALSGSAPLLTRSVWQCGEGYKEVTDRVELLAWESLSQLSDLPGSAVARSLASAQLKCSAKKGSSLEGSMLSLCLLLLFKACYVLKAQAGQHRPPSRPEMLVMLSTLFKVVAL